MLESYLITVIMPNLLSSFIEFVGLKSKMYSYRTESKNNKTAKGVKKEYHQERYLSLRLFRNSFR